MQTKRSEQEKPTRVEGGGREGEKTPFPPLSLFRLSFTSYINYTDYTNKLH